MVLLQISMNQGIFLVFFGLVMCDGVLFLMALVPVKRRFAAQKISQIIRIKSVEFMVVLGRRMPDGSS